MRNIKGYSPWNVTKLCVSAQRCLIWVKFNQLLLNVYIYLWEVGVGWMFQTILPISQLSESGQLWPLSLMIEASPASKIKTWVMKSHGGSNVTNSSWLWASWKEEHLWFRLHAIGLSWELIVKPRDGDGMSGQEWRESQSRTRCGKILCCLSAARTCFLGVFVESCERGNWSVTGQQGKEEGLLKGQESISFEEGKAWGCGHPPALSSAVESVFLEGNTHRKRRNCVQKETYCPPLGGRCHPGCVCAAQWRVGCWMRAGQGAPWWCTLGEDPKDLLLYAFCYL